VAALVVTGGSRGHPILIHMAMEDFIPIADLFEAHLTVSELDRAVAFYKDVLGLPLARLFPDRKVAFFRIGAPGRAMLGLWEAGTMPMSISLHVAFQVALSDLHEVPSRLKKAGIQPRDLAGLPTDRRWCWPGCLRLRFTSATRTITSWNSSRCCRIHLSPISAYSLGAIGFAGRRRQSRLSRSSWPI
jgi:predicted enzyme related to lactoylglutathione lyase